MNESVKYWKGNHSLTQTVVSDYWENGNRMLVLDNGDRRMARPVEFVGA